MRLIAFPDHLHRKLKSYVYIYIDPRDGEVFYVGKGKGNRAFSHLTDEAKRRKTARIRAIRAAGREPLVKILVHGLDDETALRVESAVIDLLGMDAITNEIRGRQSRDYGIMGMDQIIARYSAPEVEIHDPVCIIRVNQLFRYGMAAQELYDATRGIWVVNPLHHNPRYALAVYKSVVQEVYKIATWLPAGTTFYSTRPDLGEPLTKDDVKRQEFVGSMAEPKMRKRYRFMSVASHLKRNARSPVLYVNC